MAQKPIAPLFWSKNRLEEWIRKVAQVTQQLQKGQGNNSFTVLLDEDSTTTVVRVSFAALNQIALFSAQDSATALEIAAGTIWAVVGTGIITIHHGSDTGTRKLGVGLFG